MSADTLPFVIRWRKALPNDRRLSRTDKDVARALSDYFNAHGYGAFPGHARLAYDLGISERAIRRALKHLVDLGWLALVARSGPGRAVEYRALIPSVPPEDRTTYTPVPRSPATDEHRPPVATVGDAVGQENTGHPWPPLGATPATRGQNTGHPWPPMSHERSMKSKDAPAFAERGGRGLIFETLKTVCGFEKQALTESESGRLGLAAKELRGWGEASGMGEEAIAREVTSRAANYRKHYPQAVLTPQALTGNWTQLTPPPAPLAPKAPPNDSSDIGEWLSSDRTTPPPPGIHPKWLEAQRAAGRAPAEQPSSAAPATPIEALAAGFRAEA